jgi:hypothetical protein
MFPKKVEYHARLVVARQPVADLDITAQVEQEI